MTKAKVLTAATVRPDHDQHDPPPVQDPPARPGRPLALCPESARCTVCDAKRKERT
jgi:hypothetical protein